MPPVSDANSWAVIIALASAVSAMAGAVYFLLRDSLTRCNDRVATLESRLGQKEEDRDRNAERMADAMVELTTTLRDVLRQAQDTRIIIEYALKEK